MNVFLKIKHYWIKFGELLGRIFGPIILAVIYLVFIGLTSLIAFLFRKDFLRFRQKGSSYWITPKKENLDSLSGMELPF